MGWRQIQEMIWTICGYVVFAAWLAVTIAAFIWALS